MLAGVKLPKLSRLYNKLFPVFERQSNHHQKPSTKPNQAFILAFVDVEPFFKHLIDYAFNQVDYNKSH